MPRRTPPTPKTPRTLRRKNAPTVPPVDSVDKNPRTGKGGKKFLILNENIKNILFAAIKEGLPYKTACQLAGISDATLYEVLRRGRGQDSRKCTPEIAEFTRQFEQLTAISHRTLYNQIKDAAKDDWRAGAWILERRFPESWGTTRKIEVQVAKELEKSLDVLERKLAPEVFEQVLDALAGDDDDDDTSISD